MRRIGQFSVIGVLLLAGIILPARGQNNTDFEIDESQATVITSKRLTFDQKQQYALFEDDVMVVDPTMQLRADRLTVYFSEDNQAERIEALGRVIIRQEETTAWARKATYDVVSGTIFLEGAPRIRRGRDVLEGDTITFWRDDNRVICEPQARLVLFSDDESRDILLGE
jgi:lipopolysaccharide export system protein LptA